MPTNENEIALFLRLEQGQNTIKDIVDLDTRIKNLNQSMIKLRKEGKSNTEEFTDLATAHKALTKTKQGLNRELNKSIRQFEKYGDSLPDDSLAAMAQEAGRIRTVLRQQSGEVRKNDLLVEELGDTYQNLVIKAGKLSDEVNRSNKEMGDYSRNIGRYSESFGGLLDIIQKASGVNLSNLGIGSGAISGIGGLSGILNGGTLGDLAGDRADELLGGLAQIPIAHLAIAGSAVQLAQTMGAVNQEFDRYNHLVEQVGSVTEASIPEASAHIKAFSEESGESFDIILNNANAMVMAFGGDIPTAIEAMRKGIQAGGDLNGQFLDQIREYPKLLSNAGFSMEEFIALIVEQQRRGIYDDKLIDTIKEANIALSEFTDTQRDALETAFGADFADTIYNKINVEGATTKEIIQDIRDESEKVGLTQAEMGQITADVFKAAGEDAGGLQELIEAIGTAGEMSFDSLVIGSSEYVREQDKVYEAQVRINTAQARFAQLVNTPLLSNALTNVKAALWEAINASIEYGTELVYGEYLTGLYIDSLESEKSATDDLIKTRGEQLAQFAKSAKAFDEAQLKRSIATQKQIIEDENATEDNRAQAAKRLRILQGLLDEEIKSKKKAERENRKIETENKKIEAENKKEEEQRVKDRVKAAELTKKLNAEIIEDEFDRQRAIAELNAETQISGLVGDPKQIEENTQLIRQLLADQISVIDKSEADMAAKRSKMNAEFRQSEHESEINDLLLFNEEMAQIEREALEEQNLGIEEYKAELRAIEKAAEIEALNIRLLDESLTEDQILEYKREIWDLENEEFISKEEEKLEAAEKSAKRQEEIANRVRTAVTGGIESAVGAFGELFQGGEDQLENFGKGVLGAVFDTLESVIRANAIAALSSEVATKGLVGLGTGAVAQAIVLGLLSTLRSVLQFEDGGQVPFFPANQGGRIRGPSHTNGGVKFMTKGGFLGEARGGELILNNIQQMKAKLMFGDGVFGDIGVPGFSGSKYNDGGFIPLVANGTQLVASSSSGGAQDIDGITQLITESNRALLESVAIIFSNEINKERRFNERKSKSIMANRI